MCLLLAANAAHQHDELLDSVGLYDDDPIENPDAGQAAGPAERASSEDPPQSSAASPGGEVTAHSSTLPWGIAFSRVCAGMAATSAQAAQPLQPAADTGANPPGQLSNAVLFAQYAAKNAGAIRSMVAQRQLQQARELARSTGMAIPFLWAGRPVVLCLPIRC